MAAGVSETSQYNPHVNGILTRNGTQHHDETDLAASRGPSGKYGQIEPQRVHLIWDLFATACILTFLADITSDVVVSVLYYIEGSYLWFSMTLGFVLLSSFVMQIFSAKWFFEDNENQTNCTYILHLFHLGPVIRYYRVIRAGWRTRQANTGDSEYQAYLAEWRDIGMLRLFECFLESAPQLVLQLYIMAYNRRFEIESDLFTALAAGSSLVSLAWAIVAYTKALRDFLGNDASLSWIGFFLQIMWRMCMVASRVVALVLFASHYRSWLFLAMALHWFVMTVWLICQKTRFCIDEDGNKHLCREYLFDAVIGFVYIFCFFNLKDGLTRIRVIPYYVIMLAENTLFIVMWYPHRELYGDIEYAALATVWAGFGIGILCMLSYYNFYHPSLPVKGVCVRKQQFDMQEHQRFTICWCFCCEIRAKHNESRGDEERTSFSVRLRPHYDPRKNTRAHAHGSLPLDLGIVPRIGSRDLPVGANYGLVHSRGQVNQSNYQGCDELLPSASVWL